MPGVVLQLAFPAPVGLPYRPLHGRGDLVGIHHHLPVHVAGRPPDDLDEGGVGTEKALLVSVEDRHQGHLGQVESLTQQVDSHQNIEVAHPQFPEDLHSLQGVYLRVQVPGANPHLQEIVGQVLGHLLGDGGDQHPLVRRRPPADLGQQIVDLSPSGPDDDLGVHQAGGADQEFHGLRTAPALEGTGSGGHADHLTGTVQPLIETQGAVVQSGGEAEPVFHQDLLPAPVSLVLAADLGKGDVRLVDDGYVIVREVIQECVGGLSRLPPVQVARVVLDTSAVADLSHHLEVVVGPHSEPLGLQQLSLALQLRQPLRQLLLDSPDGLGHPLLGSHVVGGGEHVDLAHLG